MKKKLFSVLLAMTMVLSLVACGAKANGPAKDGISVCLASEPATLDPALQSAVDCGIVINHLFAGLATWEEGANGESVLAPDCITEFTEGVENPDGTVTYTYTLKDGLTWSDGKAVTANDFVFAWNRAASPETAADYGYMFDVIDGYDAMWAEDAKGDEKLNVQAPDDKTLVVTLKNQVPYWNELMAFPTYKPVREDVVANEAWATEPKTMICNGAYKIESWEHNSYLTLRKRDDYVDAAKVTMPAINFYLSDDVNNDLANFKNGDWQFIDDVPTNEIPALKKDYPDEFKIVGNVGTYYLCWNVNEDLLPNSDLEGTEKAQAEAEVRNAINLLVDRNYIVEDVAQGGQVPASSFVAMGLTDADGSEFYKNAGHNDFTGYYDVAKESYEKTWEEAKEVLKKYYTFDEASGKFTDMPSLIYLYNTNEGHKAIAEAIQSNFAQIGINMSLENQEWATFLETRKNGDFSVARNGWLGDYNDPISFLDMWTTVSGNNDVQLGKGDNEAVQAYSIDLTDLGYDIKVENGTWAETYDVVISEIKKCTDANTRYALMHKAEDLLMSTGTICPIYYYTDLYMIDDSVDGFFTTPLGFKYFMYCTINK